jgi:ABC-type proline/glycine betaine transport system substrate-binding protein
MKKTRALAAGAVLALALGAAACGDDDDDDDDGGDVTEVDLGTETTG